MDSLWTRITHEDANGVFSVSECIVSSLLGAYCREEVTLCKTCTGLSVHGHFAVVTMLKDVRQQMDLQVKSPSSTLIVAQSSCFLDTFVFVQQQAVTKPRNPFKWTSYLVMREMVSW